MKRLALSLLLLPSFGFAAPQQREAIEPPVKSAGDVALEALREARKKVELWHEAVRKGEVVTESQMRTIEGEVRATLEHLARIHERHDAQRVKAAAARPEAGVEANGPTLERANERSARSLANVWSVEAHAIGEGGAERRAAAIAEIREAIESGDALREYAAVRALGMIGDVEYDKQPFRDLVLPFTNRYEGAELASAFYALHATVPQPGDQQLLVTAWRRSPTFPDSFARLAFLFGENRSVTGAAAEIVIGLLRDPEHRHNTVGGLWGARVSDDLADVLVEFARSSDPKLRKDSIYYGLSTFHDKNEAVVDVLLETLVRPDGDNSSRALWGLSYGVSRDQQRKVAEVMLDLHNARSDAKTRQKTAKIVREYGDAEQIARLAK